MWTLAQANAMANSALRLLQLKLGQEFGTETDTHSDGAWAPSEWFDGG
jgi:hypothetical protein